MNTKTLLSRFFSILFLFIIFTQTTSASFEDKLKGYAWSDGAGWISFNCTNTNSCGDVEYGVTADASGNLSGEAWSDTFGWLSFDYHSGAYKPKVNITTGELSGRAQFLSAVAVTDDGWEGSVSLKGSSPSYGPVIDLVNTFEINGYAWGDVATGWIDFNTAYSQVTYDPFYFLFSTVGLKGLSESNKVTYDGSVILKWVTKDTDGNCTATNGNSQWTGGNPHTAGKHPAPEATYTITNMTATDTFSLTCQDSAGHSITRDLNILVKPPAPSVVLGADDLNIGYGLSTNLNWTAKNVATCTAAGAWSGPKAVGIGLSESTGPLTNPAYFFDISCQSAEPEYPNPVTDSVTIDVEKLIMEFYTADSTVPYNDKIKLLYRTEFATSCTTSGNVPGWAGHTVNLSPGEHTFETVNPITTEGQSYTAKLDCNGSYGQQNDITIFLKAGKNPHYEEV